MRPCKAVSSLQPQDYVDRSLISTCLSLSPFERLQVHRDLEGTAAAIQCVVYKAFSVTSNSYLRSPDKFHPSSPDQWILIITSPVAFLISYALTFKHGRICGSCCWAAVKSYIVQASLLQESLESCSFHMQQVWTQPPALTNLGTSQHSFCYAQITDLSISVCHKLSHSAPVKTLLKRGIHHLTEAFQHSLQDYSIHPQLQGQQDVEKLILE